jgi:hypothetical protein
MERFSLSTFVVQFSATSMLVKTGSPCLYINEQFESSENVEVVSLLVFACRFTTGLERIPTFFDDLQKH